MEDDQIIIGSNPDVRTNPEERAIGDTIAMQLASIAYCSLTNNVASTLKYYLPDWQLVWQPKEQIGGNWAFIAYNGVQYVVAIRGSIVQFSFASFDDWFKEDFNIFKQVQWTYPQNAVTIPMISKGSADGLDNLSKLKDTNGDTILSFLIKNAIPNGKFLCVTGHSLGGNLATVFGPWLRYQFQQAGQPIPELFSILTFAAPTSWNQAFVDQYTELFTHTWRYYNVLDIVPFSACNVEGLSGLFPPPAPAAQNVYAVFEGKKITLAELFLALQVMITSSELVYKSVYATVNQQRGSIPLNSARQIYKVAATDPLEQWFEQASAQHDHNHYLDWMGCPDVDCQG